MLAAFAEMQDNIVGVPPFSAKGNGAFGPVQVEIDKVERTAARNLEASNAVIAAHIGALSERLVTVEQRVQSFPSMSQGVASFSNVYGHHPAHPAQFGAVPVAPRHVEHPDEQHHSSASAHTAGRRDVRHQTTDEFDPGAVYVISSVESDELQQQKWIGVSGSGVSNDSNALLWDNPENPDSQWYFAKIGHDTYVIENQHARGKFLAVRRSQKSNNANVEISDDHQSPASQWRVQRSPDAQVAYTLENVNAPGMFLAVSGDVSVNGANVVIRSHDERPDNPRPHPANLLWRIRLLDSEAIQIESEPRQEHPGRDDTKMPTEQELERERKKKEEDERQKREREAAENDPDNQQAAYADFIALTQKNINGLGIHTWSVCASTKLERTACARCGSLLPPLVVLLVQCFLLASMGIEALHPTCTTNADCRTGMWCAPSKGAGGLTRSPGMCDDCRWAPLLQAQDYANLPNRYNAEAFQVINDATNIEEGFVRAVEHCSAEFYQDRCDYVVDIRNQLTVGPFLVLILVMFLVLGNVVLEMDKAAFSADVFEFRCFEVEEHHKRKGMLIPVRLLAWLNFTIKKFILPGILAFTFVAMVLASPPSPGVSLSAAFALDGLIAIFVYNIDFLLGMVLLDDGAQHLIREAYARVEGQLSGMGPYPPGTGPRMDNGTWLPHFYHRFFAFCLGLVMLIEVLATESLMGDMDLFRLDWDALPASWTAIPGSKTCTSVVTMLAAMTLITVTFFCIIWSVTNQIVTGFKGFGVVDLVWSPIVVLVVMPALSFLLREVQYIPIAH